MRASDTAGLSGDAKALRLSAGVVVLRRNGSGWLFLMLRAYRNWDFPKGAVEPGEEPLAAARREVREETLIEDLEFEWGEGYVETGPYANRKIARYYLAVTRVEKITLPVSPELGRPEHDEWRWVDRDEAFTLAPARLQPIVQWAVKTVGMA
ncbi:MAG TPA: NUDIX domain-containing protein [Steroidobacteraceae bacterium]|nr:NUDIX domain-containing protein [Steroidobacteraceae bacterium]